ncbi:hypothetical protein BKA70DRAFT_28649 [Coprinopsis sp. MPI-PUGE-AT-0042]|nr:hypothetical protein BKA70DRAFT_28649 [Coprinopsis sp. MPI-PUGE-AT-0042]
MFWRNLGPYFIVFLFQCTFGIMQAPLQSCFGWKIEMAEDWGVLGPFPIQAREQHFLSPGFPLNVSEPIDFGKSWPSSYADGALVTWSKVKPNEKGELLISFPEVRWKYLRAFEGWAALQHHAVLCTTFKLTKEGDSESSSVPRLLVHLIQGSYFTILPAQSSGKTVTPKWYAGDIYAMERAFPRVVELPESASGEYQLFVAGDYEIRLFGDPDVQGLDAPTQNIRVELTLGEDGSNVERIADLDVVPNFVAGYAFGKAVGVGLRAISQSFTVVAVSLAVQPEALDVSLLRETRIAPSQSRIVPIQINQTAPFVNDSVELVLKYKLDSGETWNANVSLAINHLSQWSGGIARQQILGSFFFAGSTPSLFASLPPTSPQLKTLNPPVVALHGAGVDVAGTTFWAEAMPPNEDHWTVLPAGRTSWGLDWHGPSTQDVWESLAALSKILQTNEAWKSQAFPADTRVLLLGHSNGGQGVWHVASRFPDRVIAIIPAAAYSKSQSYIPLTQSRSSHFIDPALRSILESSLTPDDNDLHVANLAHTPILAIHGGADDNVPSWHSRVLVSTLQTVSPNSSVALKEDPGQLHFYDGVVNNEPVQQFIAKNQQNPPQQGFTKSFTLTVSNPSESGPLQGFRILSLAIPGRLGKLMVELSDDASTWVVTPSNVESFSISPISALAEAKVVKVGGAKIDLTPQASSVYFVREKGKWQVSSALRPVVPTRLQTILTSPRPLTFVHAGSSDGGRAFSLAVRLSHDLQVYHRLDAEIVDEDEAIDRSSKGDWGAGNIVVIGSPSSRFVSAVLAKKQTPFHLEQRDLFFDDRWLSGIDQGYLFLHPPLSEGKGNVLFMLASDDASLERLGKLFPIRTGIAVPDWLVTGSAMDLQGAAGVEGAGVWDSHWRHNEASSWFS